MSASHTHAVVNKLSRTVVKAIGAAAGLVLTGALGVLAMRYAALPAEVVAWATLAGAVGWWHTTGEFLDEGIKYHGKKRGTRTARRVKKWSYITAYFVARAAFLTVTVGFAVGAVFFLIFAAQEAWGSIVRFFNVTPPEVSANILVAVLGTIGAIITFFGARWAEGRRATNESRRPLQRTLYPRILAAARESLDSSVAKIDLRPLRSEAMLVASQEVLDKLAQYEWLAGPGERAEQAELEAAYDELLLAMREDLGFRDNTEETNAAAWRDPSSLGMNDQELSFFQRVRGSA